jgi:hypothetical protein
MVTKMRHCNDDALPSGLFHAERRAEIYHNEHKIHPCMSVVLTVFKTIGRPVEGPNIIYGVLMAPTALVRGIDPLGKAS